MSMMKKLFNFGNQGSSRKTNLVKLQRRPHFEPLEERQMLAVTSLLDSAYSSSVSTVNGQTEMALTIEAGAGKTALIGLQVDAVDGTFDPSKIQVFDEAGNQIPAEKIRYNHSDFMGGKSSLLVLELAQGKYKVTVGGDRNSIGNFTCDVFLPGNIDKSGTVGPFAGDVATAAYMVTHAQMDFATAQYFRSLGITVDKLDISPFDIDRNGKVDSAELQAISFNQAAGHVKAELRAWNQSPTLPGNVVAGTITEKDTTTITHTITGVTDPEGDDFKFLPEIDIKSFTYKGQDIKHLLPADMEYSITDNGNGTGTFSFKFNELLNAIPEGESAELVFNYKVKDEGSSNYSIGQITVNVTGVNDKPKATNIDNVKTDEKTEVQVDFTGKISDPDIGETETLVICITGANGVEELTPGKSISLTNGAIVRMDADGKVFYNPNGKFDSLAEDASDQDQFFYSVKDIKGELSDPATVAIVIDGVNDPPVVKGDYLTDTTEKNQKTITFDDLLAMVEDPDNGDVLSVISAAAASDKGAVISYNATAKTVAYNPGSIFHYLKSGETAEDFFIVKVADAKGEEKELKVVITINGENDPITVADQNKQVTSSSAGDTLTVGNVDYTCPDHNVVLNYELLEVTGGPTGWTNTPEFSIDANGKITVKKGSIPEKTEAGGEFVLKVRVTDPRADVGKSEEILITISVIEYPAPIIKPANPISGNEKVTSGQTVTLEAQDGGSEGNVVNFVPGSVTVKSQDPALAGLDFTATITSSGNNQGTFSFKINTPFSGVPAGQTAKIVFEYIVRESKYGVETVGTIEVVISGENDLPVINGDQNTGVSKSGTKDDIDPLLNANDPDYGESSSLVIGKINGEDVAVGSTVTLASGAIVTVNADGTLKYDPNNKFDNLNDGDTASDSFKYQVKDRNGDLSNEATVNVTISGSNLAHSVPDQTMNTSSTGAAGPVNVGKVQVNDIDGPKGDYVYSIESVSGGTDPGFAIDPDTGMITVNRENLPTLGTYTVVVKVSDDDFERTGTITIVVAEKAPPTCQDVPIRDAVGEKDSTASNADLKEFVKPTDPGDVLKYLNNITLGSAVLTNTGGSTNITLSISAADVAKMCSVNSDGIFSFAPNANNADVLKFLGKGETLTLVFIYSVQDEGTGAIGTGKITVVVNGVNDNPIANDDDFRSTGILATDTSDPLDVLANDTDVDTNDSRTIIQIAGESISEGQTINVPVTINGEDKGNALVKLENGKLVFNPNGAFGYLKAGETADFTFSYTISDGKGGSDTADVTVKIVGKNAAPTVPTTDLPAEVDRNTAGSNNSVTINILDGAADPNGDAMKLATINGLDMTPYYGGRYDFPGGGYLTIDATGTVVKYHIDTLYADLGKDLKEYVNFTFQLTDGMDVSDTRNVKVTVNGKNDPPKVENNIQNQSGREGTVSVPLELAGQEYFSDPNGDALTYSIDPSWKTKDIDKMIEDVWVDDTTKTLYIKFTSNYTSKDKRIPVSITITATDKHGDSVSQTFTAVALPQMTANTEIKIVHKDDASDWNATTLPESVDEMIVDESYYIEIWVTDLANTVGSPGYVPSPPGYEHLPYSNGLGALRFDFSLDLDKVTIEEYYYATDGIYCAVEYTPRIYNGVYYPMDPPKFDSETGLSTYEWIGGGIRVMPGVTPPSLGVNGDSWLIGRILVTPKKEGTFNTDIAIQELSRFSDVPDADQALPISQINVIPAQIPIVDKSNPLHGLNSKEAIAEGGVYVRNVTSPTQVRSDGSVAALPENATWIHEWQEHWAEIWVPASKFHQFQNAMTDLIYNSDYFTAVEVTPGKVFKSSFVPNINDAEGLVSGIGGTASGEVPQEGFILLGRVKFESIGDDNVPFEEALIPHDLGITLDNVSVTTIEGNVITIKGNSPNTELWAVPYDINDDGIISISDYMSFTKALVNQPKSGDIVVSLFDYDRDGIVAMADWSVFVKPLLGKVSRDDYSKLSFHDNFMQRYVGQTINADSMETVNTIIDAANKAWQNALGLDKPIDIQVIVKDLGPDVLLGEAQIVALDTNGLPNKGIITIDDDGGGLGWYSQLDEPVTQGRYDLYTVILHEMGHVYGFTSNYDAFKAIVGQFGTQIDAAGVHATKAGDLMSATLEAGIRKYISTLDADAVLAAYDAAKVNPELRDFISAPTHLVQTETTPVAETTGNTALGLMAVSESSWVTHHAVVLEGNHKEMIDAGTAAKLHAMGLSVSLDISKTAEVAFSNDIVFESEFLIDENLDGSFFQNYSGKHNLKDLTLLDLELEWNADI